MNPLPSGSIQQESAAPPVKFAGGQPQRPQEAADQAIAEFIIATVAENLGVQVEGHLRNIEPVPPFLVTTRQHYFQQRHPRIGTAGFMPALALIT